MASGLAAVMAAMLAASTTASGPTQESTSSATAQIAAAQEKAEDKIVCRRITPTGSRLGGERVCKPKSWWDDVRNEAQKGLGQHQQRGLQANPGNAPAGL